MIKLELHCHTKYSFCSNMEPKDLVQACIEKEINVLAVTDHNEIEGALEVAKIAPFKVIISEEIKSLDGEVIGYFLQEKISKDLPIKETIKRIKEQGGLVCIPHPFCSLRARERLGESMLEVIDEIDMIEVFNGRIVFQKNNREALAFAEEHNLLKTVGSDAHFRGEVGNAVVLMEDFETKEEFLKNLVDAKFQTRKSPIWQHMKTVVWRGIRGEGK